MSLPAPQQQPPRPLLQEDSNFYNQTSNQNFIGENPTQQTTSPYQSSMPQAPPSQDAQPSQQQYQPYIQQSAPTSSPMQSDFTPTYCPPPQDQFADKVDDSAFAFKSPEPFYSRTIRYVSLRYQLLLDASAPHWAARWTFSLVILLVFMARIVMAQGWYVICYGLSIYYLNLFIGFLSPKIDPAFASGSDDFDDLNDSDTGPMLPTRANDEFRPFIRRLPEFKFWLSATTATLISLVLTMFEVFDLPVFWPILLLYFILLFVSTMRQQIRHMLKYGYVPWDKGKKKYGPSSSANPDSLFSTTI